jgi:hypothetical protein
MAFAFSKVGLRTGTFLVGVHDGPVCGRAGHKLIRALAVLLHDAPRQACLMRELVAASAACVVAKLPTGDVNIVAAELTIKVFVASVMVHSTLQ